MPLLLLSDSQTAYQPTLTGHGQPLSDCGKVGGVVACPQGQQPQQQIRLDGKPRKHTLRLIVNSCDRLACPRCSKSAAVRAGKRCEERLLQVGQLHGLGTPRHFALSPPPEGKGSWGARFAACKTEGEWHEQALLFKRKAHALLKRHGLKGGAIVFHPWRCAKKDGGGSRYHEAALYLSPHVHVIAWGRLTNSAEFHPATKGWVYANLTNRRGKHDLREGGIVAVVAYLLAHVGVIKERNSLGYWGCAGTAVVILAEERKERLPVLCETCQHDCWEYTAPTGKFDWTGVLGPAIEVHVHRVFKLRDKNEPGRKRNAENDAYE